MLSALGPPPLTRIVELLFVSFEETVKIASYFVFSVLAAGAVGGAALLLLSRSKAAPPVAVVYCGVTNDATGDTLHTFQVTNAMTGAIHGSHAVEVYHNGVWFNALPQPKSSQDFTMLQAHEFLDFRVPVPTGRAQTGLRVQTNPPGEKWRVYFSYVGSSHLSMFGRLIESFASRLGAKRKSKQYYVFGPDIPFSPANRQGGANGRQPLHSEEDRDSAAAASRRSP